MYEATRFTSNKIFYFNPNYYHFTYPLFSFVKAPSLVLTAILTTIQKILAFMITIGILFRLIFLRKKINFRKWDVFLLQFQIFVIYTYDAIA